MDSQTLIVLLIVAAAALYVGRRFWPARHKQIGCGSCPQNRNRADDYA
ncbi:MAG: FeoB-associated Cys-rich membrane protein [Deltaproteobacteria bacterium]|nr:FeoB-associated Cys-rich membrane protein [Deltaproteobacteria bacterium]